MQQQPISDPRIIQHLSTIATDGVDLFLLAEGTVRLVIIHGTTMANLMVANHNPGGPGAAILTEGYLLGALASSTLKNEESLGLLVESDGPIRGLSVDANAFGHIRGYLQSEVSQGDWFGDGTLELVRVSVDRPRPVRGQVELTGGSTLTAALQEYFRQSEQTATAITTSIDQDQDSRILGAGALLVQAMPGADRSVFQMIAEEARRSDDLGAAFSSGATAADLVRTRFNHWNPHLVATRNVEFFCSCSEERFMQFLAALPEKEQEDILLEGPFPLVTTCHNCNSNYSFSRETLTALFADKSD